MKLLLVCSAAVFFSLAACSIAAETRRPNIILLESDDHHYQALGCMGDPVRTPNIDRLAARGALFRNNICQGTMCSPSRNALLTASYPHNTGIYHNRDGNMAAGVWTFPQALQRAGYRTALVGKNHFKPHSEVSLRERTSAIEAKELKELGFEYVHSTRGKVAAATSKNGAGDDPYCLSLENKGLLDDLAADYKTRRGLADLTDIRASVLSVDDYHDTYIADRAIDFLKTAGDDRPFFLWVDFVAPHPPADAPEPYASMYKAGDMRKPLSGDSSTVVPAKRRTVTEEHYRNFRAAYYGMISLLDEQIGRIVAELEADGRLDDTVIIFTGDQGSMLGDFGLFGKGVFYKGSINSPLVVAGPAALVRHSIIDRPVQLIDLAPTILTWAGSHPDDRERCRGQSLAPLLAGSGGHPHTAAFSEDAETKLIVTERYKLASNERGSLLFDLQADPNETQNLFGKRPDLEADLLKQIESWQSATGPTLPPNPRTPVKRK